MPLGRARRTERRRAGRRRTGCGHPRRAGGGGGRAPGGAGGRAVTGGRVLVVDDGELNRRVLVRALEAEGHTAAQAVDGRAALELLRREPFDVVLLDLVMPEMDGYETLAAIKADETLRHLPVIVIS